ncbi:hypothetical protein ZWY2020_046308 [Hordeum vulgare]|nr:hypothetical protein ZWY2020_046308 [Hordeum vulgare]
MFRSSASSTTMSIVVRESTRVSSEERCDRSIGIPVLFFTEFQVSMYSVQSSWSSTWPPRRALRPSQSSDLAGWPLALLSSPELQPPGSMVGFTFNLFAS